MKWIVALLLVFFAGVAQAQDCLPRTWLTPAADGGLLLRGEGVGGKWFAWNCPKQGTQYAHAVLDSHQLDAGTLNAALSAMLAAADPLLMLRSVIAATSKPPADASERGRLETLVADGHAAVQESLVPRWKVKANPASTTTPQTRPAYRVVNGVRQTISAGRAVVGEPCDPVRESLPATGGDVWAIFGPDFNAGLVALCERSNS